MLLVARKNLFSEKTRLAISVGGVALSVFLIGILLALFRGWSIQVGGFVESVPADLWAASDGTTDFVAAASVLPAELYFELSEREEVTTASPLVVRPLKTHIRGEDPDSGFDIQLVGYEPRIGLGGPLEVVGGKAHPGPGDVIIDEQTHKRYGVEIGDELVRGDRTLTVVGFASGGDFVYTQVAFTRTETALEFLGIEDEMQRTFFALSLAEPQRRDAVAAQLEQALPGVQFIHGEGFAAETRDRILGNILPILIVVLIVAFVVGLSVAGLTIYTATVEKSREYGILKAEGFTNAYLYRVVFEQSVVTGVLGFLTGAGITLLVAPFAQDAVPQFVVFIRWQDVLLIAGVTLVMALLAAYIPIRRLSNIDPVTVFKG
jgi:putative ABC transport system permease protein